MEASVSEIKKNVGVDLIIIETSCLSVRIRASKSQITSASMQSVKQDFRGGLMTSDEIHINYTRYLINVNESAAKLNFIPTRTSDPKGKTISIMVGFFFSSIHVGCECRIVRKRQYRIHATSLAFIVQPVRNTTNIELSLKRSLLSGFAAKDFIRTQLWLQVHSDYSQRTIHSILVFRSCLLLRYFTKK